MEITGDIEQIFKPLLKQFCEKTKPVEIDEDFFNGFSTSYYDKLY